MRQLVFRFLLSLLLFIYLSFIWLQSSYFNPSKLEYLSKEISYKVYVMIGATLELAHLIEFGILYFMIISVSLTFGRLTLKKEVIALAISLMYAAIDEIHQYYVPYRSFSAIDMVKNTIGVWVIWYLVRRKYYSNKQTRIGSFLKGITNISRRNKSNIHL